MIYLRARARARIYSQKKVTPPSSNAAPAVSGRNESGVPFSSPASKLPSGKLFEELNSFSHSNILRSQNTNLNNVSQSHANDLIRSALDVILKAVADHVEMHHNIGEQRDKWNTLLLNSINMITLAASTMTGFAAAASGAPLLTFKLSSGLVFSTAMGMLLRMNKTQPLQLAEEQRNAKRLFRQLQNEIEAKLAIGKVTKEDIKSTMAKVLALDKDYPLPLLGAMIEKFSKKFEQATWWPSSSSKN